jgi:hypothetical protein
MGKPRVDAKITPEQLKRIIYLIQISEGVSLAALARRCGISKGTMERINRDYNVRPIPAWYRPRKKE